MCNVPSGQREFQHLRGSERGVAFAHDEDLLVVAAGLRSEEEAEALAQLGVAAG